MTASRPPTGTTAHEDTFVRDRLPPHSQWPVLLYDSPELDYAPQTNVAAELLDRHVAEGRGSRVALHTDDGPWTYERLLHTANRLAHVLVEDLGVVPGNRILLRAPNNPDMLACWLAAAKAGAVIVATMPLLRSRELQTITDKAEIALALCDDRLTDELDGAVEACPSLERVERFSRLRTLAEARSEHFDNVETAIDDPVLIAFTSGTTGAPKGCVHFHRDVLASADTFFKGTMPCHPDDVFAGSPPLAFTFGLGMQAVFPLRIGASAALVEKPTPESLLDACAAHGSPYSRPLPPPIGTWFP